MTNLHSIKTILLRAATQLKSQGIDAETAKLETQLLLQHALNVNRAWLIAHDHENLPPSIHEAYRAMLERRLNGEPIAYILGYREFYGLNLKVTADTLIPRPDTETLVEAALAKIPQSTTSSPPSFPRKRESMLNLKQKMDSRFRGNDELRVLDLGTGTGAIALAVAKHRPHVLVTAVDTSENALKIAQENAQNLQIANVQFTLSNWFDALKYQRFDVIVSNPPYIEANDAHLNQGDLRFEPLLALASGVDGLDAIRHIINSAPHYLKPHGWLALEHGYNQAEAVANLLKKAGFSEIETRKDLGEIGRAHV